MIKTIIIEDEIQVREALKKMLILLMPKIQVIAETGFVNEAVELINKHQPKLVFLDIKLEDGTGFDIINKIENPNFKIIFTTAYNQYAIKAFKVSAIDYLLKPIDPLELQVALEKAISILDNEKEHQELIQVLKNNEQAQNKKIVLKTTENRYVINIKDIIRLEADGAYTIFYTKDQKIIISKNLKFYQELLNEQFIRCHQSHLVNKTHITKIDNKGFLLLSNEQTVPISTRKKNDILKQIENL